MTLKEIIEAKDRALISAPLSFNAAVDAAQRQLLQQALQLVGQLEYSEGLLVLSETNYARIGQIIEAMRGTLSRGEYASAVVGLATNMAMQASLTRDYFDAVFGDAFSDKALYQMAFKKAQQNALLSLTSEGIDANFLNIFRDQLTDATSATMSRGQLESTVRLFIEGDAKRLGRLRGYTGQIADDIFSIIDRSYTKIISEDLDVQFYLYSGGIIDDSRPFCVTRHNKYYHRMEVAAWGSLADWTGKIAGTNQSTIFIYAGGYRCRHSILPVAISSVPEAVIRRAERLGFM